MKFLGIMFWLMSLPVLAVAGYSFRLGGPGWIVGGLLVVVALCLVMAGVNWWKEFDVRR